MTRNKINPENGKGAFQGSPFLFSLFLKSRLPTTPFFVCGRVDNWIELENAIERGRTIYRPYSPERQDFTVYDSSQKKWTMWYECPSASLWERTIGMDDNTRAVVPIRWKQDGCYELDDLRGVFLKAVDGEFVTLTCDECAELRVQLLEAQNFEEFERIWLSVGMHI